MELDHIKSLYDELYDQYKHTRSYLTYIFIKLKLNKELISYIDSFLLFNTNRFSEKMYCVLNNIRTRPKCVNCENEVQFKGFILGYSNIYCKKCARKTPEYLKKMCISRPNKNKGKTYSEIYGTDRPKCGYQPGENNISKRPDIRKKISIGVTNSYTPELRNLRSLQNNERVISGNFKFGDLKYPNKFGEKFRSSLEVKMSEFLREKGIKYIYEYPIKMINGKYKIVDFYLPYYRSLIEISGYAYDGWRQDFDNKIQILLKSTNKFIIILTYEDKLEKIIKNNTRENLFFGDISDLNRCYETLKFCRDIYKGNKWLSLFCAKGI